MWVCGEVVPHPSGDTEAWLLCPRPHPHGVVCIWLFLVCVLCNRLCAQTSVGHPYNLVSLWSSWEPLNPELSEAGSRWPPEILGVLAVGAAWRQPWGLACVLGGRASLRVLVRLPESLWALRLPASTLPSASTTRWGHTLPWREATSTSGPQPSLQSLLCPQPHASDASQRSRTPEG